MVSPAGKSKTVKTAAPKRAAKGGAKKAPAEKRGMGKDHAEFSAASLTAAKPLALPNVKQGDLALKGTVQPGQNGNVDKLHLEGTLDGKGKLKLDQDAQGFAVDAETPDGAPTQLSVGASQKQGKTVVHGKLGLKAGPAELEVGYGVKDGLKGKATIKAAKGLELGGEVTQGKKGLGGKGRLKLDKTTVEVGSSQNKLEASVTQAITPYLSLGVGTKAGKATAKAQLKADALTLSADLGEISTVEAGYKQGNFEAKGFADTRGAVGFKFGFSTKF